MQDIIRLLPDSVANQIAAGEVVQRPSSIVKEMMENAIDAEATRVQVVVIDGGKTSVQVIDNGKGMSETDARLSFERHATSKISQAADLYALHTMGFRGEALASIAAVAQVELKTRRPSDELGTLIQINGSHVERQEPVACPVGSNFTVKNLFYNVPARRKFLKSATTEMNNIIADFERIALVYPQIEMDLVHGQTSVHHLEPATLRQRILDICGKRLDSTLLPVETDTTMIRISGFVASPESAKKKGARQFFFVNGRYMRHPYFHSAVMHAYDQLIPAGEHVSYFLYMDVDPAAIDVNVHPTKTEIKFDDEQAIWQILSAAVKETLGRFFNVPTIDFDTKDRPDIPVIGTLTGNAPQLRAVDYNPFSSAHKLSSRPPLNWQKLYQRTETFEHPRPNNRSLVTPDEQATVDNLVAQVENSLPPKATPVYEENLFSDNPADLPHFQYHGRFIVVPTPSGILFVDQHRAHTRILYEQYIRQVDSHMPSSQRLLFPELVHFTADEANTIESILPQLDTLGFELTNLGGSTYSIVAMPTEVGGIGPSRLLHDLVYAAMELGAAASQKDVEKTISLALARSTAVVYGQVLSEAESSKLLTDLFQLATPTRTPDGKPTVFLLEHHFIERNF